MKKIIARATLANILIFALLLTPGSQIFAENVFTEPETDFPNGNPAAPLDSSKEPQQKAGNLRIGGELGSPTQGTSVLLKRDSISLVDGGDSNINFSISNFLNPVMLSRGLLSLNVKGVKLPNLLTSDVSNPQSGTVIFDTNSKTLQLYDGTKWGGITGGGGGGAGDSLWQLIQPNNQAAQLAQPKASLVPKTLDVNVGIGKNNPTVRLDVAGDIKASGKLCIGNDCRSAWPTGGTGGGDGVWQLTNGIISPVDTSARSLQVTGDIVALNSSARDWRYKALGTAPDGSSGKSTDGTSFSTNVPLCKCDGDKENRICGSTSSGFNISPSEDVTALPQRCKDVFSITLPDGSRQYWADVFQKEAKSNAGAYLRAQNGYGEFISFGGDAEGEDFEINFASNIHNKISFWNNLWQNVNGTVGRLVDISVGKIFSQGGAAISDLNEDSKQLQLGYSFNAQASRDTGYISVYDYKANSVKPLGITASGVNITNPSQGAGSNNKQLQLGYSYNQAGNSDYAYVGSYDYGSNSTKPINFIASKLLLNGVEINTSGGGGEPGISSQWNDIEGGGITYQGGNVGVGTPNPKGALDVSGSGNAYFGSNGLMNLNVTGNLFLASRSGGAEYTKVGEWEGSSIDWTSGGKPISISSWPQNDTTYGNIRANRLSCDQSFDARDCLDAFYPSGSADYMTDLWITVEAPAGENSATFCPARGCKVRPKADIFKRSSAPGGDVFARNANLSQHLKVGDALTLSQYGTERSLAYNYTKNGNKDEKLIGESSAALTFTHEGDILLRTAGKDSAGSEIDKWKNALYVKDASNAARVGINIKDRDDVEGGDLAPLFQINGAELNVPGVKINTTDKQNFVFLVPEVGAGGYNGLSKNGDAALVYSPSGGLMIGPWSPRNEAVGLRLGSGGDSSLGGNLTIKKTGPGYAFTSRIENSAPSNSVELNCNEGNQKRDSAGCPDFVVGGKTDNKTIGYDEFCSEYLYGNCRAHRYKIFEYSDNAHGNLIVEGTATVQNLNIQNSASFKNLLALEGIRSYPIKEVINPNTGTLCVDTHIGIKYKTDGDLSYLELWGTGPQGQFGNNCSSNKFVNTPKWRWSNQTGTMIVCAQFDVNTPNPTKEVCFEVNRALPNDYTTYNYSVNVHPGGGAANYGPASGIGRWKYTLTPNVWKLATYDN